MAAPWPDEDVVVGWIERLSNWRRWGDDDQLGTLNLITPQVRLAAAASVSAGVTVSCGLDLSTSAQVGDAHGAARRYMVRTGQSTRGEPGASTLTPHGGRYDACAEYIGLVFHGPNVTHVDALCHTAWDRTLFNGVSVDAVSVERGAARLAVTAAASGIVTRCVVLDAARHAGLSWLAPGTAIDADDLDAIAESQGVEVRPGDAVLLRTGYGLQRREGVLDVGQRSGWHPDVLPWLRSHDVALIGSDGFNEALPNPYLALPMPIHIVGQVGIGLWLLDNLDLEAASEMAVRERRWEAMLSVALLRIPGGTGSPVNPVVVF